MAKVKKRGRVKTFRASDMINLRLEWLQHQKLKELAETQSLYYGQLVTVADLIRGAIHFTFEHNELLREFFRRRKKLAKTRFRF